MSSTSPVPSLPFGSKIVYALGQFGWSLGSYSVANLINYFYLPPEEGAGAIFPPFVFQGAILGIMTIVGVLNFGGRLFDAITDPLIAGASDRTKSRLGKRRPFMAVAALPFAVLSVLVFLPPVRAVVTANVAWLAVMIALFYVAMTAYVVPYTALISELGHTPNERLTLSTLISITWALGFAVGNQVYAIQGAFEATMDPVAAFQTTILIFAGVSFVFMMLPVFFINERKYSEERVSKEGSFQALFSTFANRNFLVFALSDFMYWLALTFIQTGISYYVTTLLGFETAFASQLLLILFVLSFVFYVPINFVAKKIGKKKLVTIAFIVFAVVFVTVSLLGILPFPNSVQAYLMIVLAAFPLAVFGILPNAIVADLAEADGIEKGNYKAGVFFGARALMMKLGISVANLLFPSFLLLGRSVANPTGIRVTGIAALVFSLLGLILFRAYNEKKVLATLDTKEDIGA